VSWFLAPQLRFFPNQLISKDLINIFTVGGAPGAPNGSKFALFACISLIFALAGRLVKGVSASGAAAGAIVCFLLLYGASGAGFLALVAVFALTWVATRFGYSRKQRLGTAEGRAGRSASQVLANLGLASAAAVFSALSCHRGIFLVMMAAALSEAAADTVASEVGQLHDHPRLITTWQPVPAGTDGAVSLPGTLAGVAAAGAISLVCLSAQLVSWRGLAISMVAGCSGMLFDSVLGATLERRRMLNNNWVNFLGTLIAALIASFLF
jgi:uncharacterized protein (TIGR00297 family)